MFFINAYRQGKTWCFDDKLRGLVAEPFVLGASELIQKYLDRKSITDTENVPLVFSLQPFPQHDVVLNCYEKNYPTKWFNKIAVENYSTEIKSYVDEMTEEKATSGWYIDQEGDKCWLCPAQIKFFGQVADIIYAKIG